MRQIPNNFRALPSPFSRIRCQRRRRRRHFAPSGNTHTREPTIQPPATSLCHSPNAKLWKWPPSEWFRPMYCSLPRPRHFFRPRTDEWMLCGGPHFLHLSVKNTFGKLLRSRNGYLVCVQFLEENEARGKKIPGQFSGRRILLCCWHVEVKGFKPPEGRLYCTM